MKILENKIQKLTKAVAHLLGCGDDELLESFRPAGELDFEDIIAFRCSNLDNNLSWNDREYIAWRYCFDKKPSDSEVVNRIWILKIRNKLIGIVGIVEIPLLIKEIIVKAGHPLDIMVDKTMDGLGIGAWMKLIINSKYDVLLVIGANENSKSMVKRMFHQMPNREMWKLPLSTEVFFNKLNLPAALLKMLVPICDFILGLFGAIKRVRLIDDGYRLQDINRFDDSINDLNLDWENCVFYRKRTAEFLNQRFLNCPTKKFYAVGLVNGNVLCAYLIYSISENKRLGLKAEILDFFWRSPKGKEGLDQLSNLFLKFSERMKEKDVFLIQLTSYGCYPRKLLRQVGFIFRPDENLLFSISNNKGDEFNFLYESEKWFLTDADAHGAGY